MTLARVQIQNFRLIRSLELELAPGVNLFAGANAQGKTSILEALHYLSVGRSFRTTRDLECRSLQSKPEDITCATAYFSNSEDANALHVGPQKIRFAYAKPRKHFWLNDHPLQTISQLWGHFTTVIFEPSDMQLLQGAPGNRRLFLDRLLGQLNRENLSAQKNYTEALNHRNALLRAAHGRSRNAAPAEFDAYEAQMAKYGALMGQSRMRCLEKLSTETEQLLQQIAPGNQTLKVLYEPGIAGFELFEVNGNPVDQLRQFWAARRPQDLERGTTNQGFHRDDFTLLLNQQDARTYASQGEIRSCTLAIRLAELRLLATELPGLPLLLLDDILGELDRQRAERFLELVAEQRVQTLVTATNAQPIEARIAVERRFHVQNGGLVEG